MSGKPLFSSKASGGHYISPSNHEPAAKKPKQLPPRAFPIPSSLMAVFSNTDGERAGTQVELPADATPKQLELLINSLLHNEEALPYACYINDVEVTSSLAATLQQLADAYNAALNTPTPLSADALNFEQTLAISYQPLSVFRVRPVTRCMETMPGHTDAVLHVQVGRSTHTRMHVWCLVRSRLVFVLPSLPPALS